MKRILLAAVAAATLLTGGATASAMPVHPIFHGPTAPIGFHPGGPGGFHPTPIGFHPGPVTGWRGPHPGWGYHGWGFGAFVPNAFLAPAYFVADFAGYGLAAPPTDCEWVQDGPNALLINLDTQQVIEVVPNAFA